MSRQVKNCTHKFRLSESLRDRIKSAAKQKGVTVSGLITEAIEGCLNGVRYDAPKKVEQPLKQPKKKPEGEPTWLARLKEQQAKQKANKKAPTN